jgi:hypothetical protein
MPDKIIMPIGFKVPITGGVITVNVAPSGIDWVWRVDELVKGTNRVISYRAVPDIEEIDFTDLVGIDPTSLQPMAEPEPVWYSWAEGLAQAAGNAEQSAEDSKLAAIESQTSALASKNAAAGSATEAYNYMQGAGAHANYAGNSAFSAGNSAATALGHKNDAEASASAAEQAKSDAFLYRDGAQIARTYSEEARDASINAKTDSESARDQSIALRDEAIAARGATVTTGLVDENGHLILTRDDTTETDAGYVIGPPINLVISDINTGPAPATVVGPTGPQGPKGDPGGWTTSVITNGTNLDTVITPGLYLNPNVNASAGPSNTAGYGGHLEVIASSGWIIQRYTNIFESRETYIRYRNSSGTWGPWYAHTTARVDQTAGRVIYQWDDVNNRDQIIYGDTGWREVKADILTGFTAGSLRIRRVNNLVSIKWDGLQATAQPTSGIPAYTPPTGFGNSASDPSHYGWNNLCASTSNVGNIWATGMWGGKLVFTQCIGTFSAGLYYNGGLTYHTEASWPNTLPGTAIGGIPNL